VFISSSICISGVDDGFWENFNIFRDTPRLFLVMLAADRGSKGVLRLLGSWALVDRGSDVEEKRHLCGRWSGWRRPRERRFWNHTCNKTNPR
jgi:hypothetical protein